jgi:hypothetical protein
MCEEVRFVKGMRSVLDPRNDRLSLKERTGTRRASGAIESLRQGRATAARESDGIQLHIHLHRVASPTTNPLQSEACARDAPFVPTSFRKVKCGQHISPLGS